MFADATVYSGAFYAVGCSPTAKRHAAAFSGGFQIFSASVGAFDVLRRAIYGSEPVSDLMMIVGAIALAANLSCLALLSKHRESEVHIRASGIFSVNDVSVAGLLCSCCGEESGFCRMRKVGRRGRFRPVSAFVHDILDHALRTLGPSGHRNEAIALMQSASRTGADHTVDFAQMVDEALLQGRAPGEGFTSYPPFDPTEHLPPARQNGKQIVG